MTTTLKKIIALCSLLLCVIYTSQACDKGSMSIVSQVTNPDGSITYTLDVTVEFGGLDPSYYGFALIFESAHNTPTVMLGGSATTTSVVNNALLSSGSTDPLNAAINTDISTISGDNAFKKYIGTNAISYEHSGIFSSLSNDITFQIQVTVMGCVENILLDAHVAAESNSCLYNVSTGISCATCSIDAIAAGTQTACDPGTNQYTQEIIITYTNAPTTGTLNVNGQSFPIGTSAQTITLTGLTADSNPVNVTASFSDDAGCTLSDTNIFTAPAPCSTTTPCTPDNGTWD